MIILGLTPALTPPPAPIILQIATQLPRHCLWGNLLFTFDRHQKTRICKHQARGQAFEGVCATVLRKVRRLGVLL